MKVFMMAAGLGERLKPLTFKKPKALMPLANKPAIIRLLEMLSTLNKKFPNLDIQEVFINLHKFPEDVKDLIGAGTEWGITVHYSVEPEPLGTAGGIAKIGTFLKDDRFILMNTDIATDIDIIKAIEFHNNTEAKMTLILTDRYSDDLSMADQLISVADNNKVLVDLDSSKDILARARKGIYTGIAICEPSIIDLIPHGYSTLLDAVLYPLAKEGLLYGYFTTGYWRDIGTIDNYMKANFDIISGLTKLPISGRLIGDNIWIDETAEIDFTVQIEEPVLIGKGVQIERGAKIGPYVVIDDGCEIGPKVEIKQSILWKKSKIEGSSTIKSSIITEEQKVPMGNRLRRVILQDGVAEAIFNV